MTSIRREHATTPNRSVASRTTSGAPCSRRALFRFLINNAIANGAVAHESGRLGAQTLVAINAVASAHPWATPELITAAFDAFTSEPS